MRKPKPGIAAFCLMALVLLPLAVCATAWADGSGAYTDTPTIPQAGQIPDRSAADTNQMLLNTERPETTPGSPAEESGLTPDELNEQNLNQANQERRAAGFGQDAEQSEYPMGPPPPDTPSGGFKMLILDEKGKTKRVITSE